MIITKIEARPLPYAYDALSPVLTAETLTFHHDKHYTTYVNKLNELIESTPFANMSLESIVQRSGGAIFNNAAQVLNHEFYFGQLSPTPQVEPSGPLLDAIVAKYGSVERLKEHMHSCAMALFGSGWVWLATDSGGRLSVINEQNAGNPIIHGLTPLLTIDVWEHAYYIDYRNNRAEAVSMFWNVVDWGVVEERYTK
ncbi:MAG: superoxide dismutase [Rikenellaceae bacterium]